jgi:hypothetical protein
MNRNGAGCRVPPHGHDKEDGDERDEEHSEHGNGDGATDDGPFSTTTKVSMIFLIFHLVY